MKPLFNQLFLLYYLTILIINLKRFLYFLLIFFSIHSYSQNIYKTPTGKKYHLASCRMVENVSKKINTSEIVSYHLTPCKICKPPKVIVSSINNNKNKAVGTSKTVQCKGFTLKGKRCKHKTSLANGYCYQHTKQQSNQHKIQNKTVSLCGARTKTGKSCKRKVKGGGYCYQHK